MRDKKIPIELMAADPAQSAPSAEQLSAERFWTLHYEDPDDVLQYGLADSQRESVYKFAEAYAALRTAQLEREKSEQYEQWFKEVATLNDRERISQAKLETAESAMRDAREKTIQECAKTLDGLARPMKKQLKKGRT